MQTSRLNTILKSIFLTLLVPAVAVALWGVYSVIVSNQSCTVGITGTAASITFQGHRSNDVCQSIVDSSASSSTKVYLMTAAPQGTVLCEGEYAYQGYRSGLDALSGPTVHYIVRDTGLFDLVGSTTVGVRW